MDVARTRQNMFFSALLLLVVPASSCAAATEALCLLQADISVDSEGSIHAKGHLVREEDPKVPEEVPKVPGSFFTGKRKWDFSPAEARDDAGREGPRSKVFPYTWDSIDRFHEQALLKESTEPDDAWASLFTWEPEHRSKKLIVLAIVILLACFALHSTVLWRMHKAANLEMGGRQSFGPTPSEVNESIGAELMRSVRQMAYLWPIIIIESIGMGLVGPSDAYLNLDFFSKKHGGPDNAAFMCAVAPHMPACEKAVEDNVHLSMILGAVAPVVYVLLGPMIGAFSDTLGRRPLIVLVHSLFFVPWLFRSLYVFYGVDLEISFWLTPVADIPLGGVLAAYFSDFVQDPRILAAMFGLMGAIMSCSSVIGLLAGAHLSIKTAFTVFICIKAAIVLYVIVFLPESLPRERRAPFSWKYMLPGMSLDVLVKTPIRRTLTAIVLLACFCDSGYARILPSYQMKYFNWDKDANYTQSIAMLVSVIVWQGALLPYITACIGETAVISVARWCGECMGIGLLLSTMNWHHFTYMGIFFGPVNMAFPVLQALNSRSMSAQEQGRGQSSLNTVKSVMEAIGPPIFGAIFDGNRNKTQLQMAWRMCLAASCVNFCCVMLLLNLPKHIKELMSEERAALKKAKAEKTPLVEEEGWIQHSTKDVLQKRITWASEEKAVEK